MTIHSVRRTIKGKVTSAADSARERVPYIAYALTGLVLVVLVFCVVQLGVVSVLSPTGQVLREYNEEKELLIEENRILEQKIAERTALGIIKTKSEKELSMGRTSSVMYLRVQSVSAEVVTNQ